MRKQIMLLKKNYTPRFIVRYFIKKYSFENSVKNTIRVFYEGYSDYNNNGYDIEPIVQIQLSRLGITKILIKKKSNILHLTIEAERVGLMIGKGGKDIDKLKNVLIERFDLTDVKFYLTESKLWKSKFF